MSQVLVTGATGFVGRALVAELLKNGHQVSIVTRKSHHSKFEKVVKVFEWDGNSDFPSEAMVNVDSIVHLAGANVSEGRWSEARKKELTNSRIDYAQKILTALKKENKRLKVFLSASATGFYGERGDALLDEGTAKGEGFLSDLCEKWEAAAKEFSSLADRVISLRFGIVLGLEGGALSKMLPIFKLGLGGPLGNGMQWMSWIHLDDVVGIIKKGLDDSRMVGIFNAVSPEPISNIDFTKILASVLHRPAFLPAPAIALKLAFGEMSEILLGSQRVLPKRTLESGYDFKFKELKKALESILASKAPN